MIIATLAAQDFETHIERKFFFLLSFGEILEVKISAKLKKNWNALNLALVVAISNYTHSKEPISTG